MSSNPCILFAVPGYQLGDLEEGEDRLLLVHSNVPITTAEVLGVPTLMSRMLEAEELDFSFGQTDSLTHRLNLLLQEYTDGFAVPKELIQNADDAGATVVKLLYDQRQNEDAKTCLIDEGMRECQGPALWAYNDAVFTDEDFENITKLSGATKEAHTDKIGRFGLGFNAVYNLTDVPSFVSRHNIVIFDPHTTHLGKSIKNKSKPGIKIDVRKHKRKMRRLGNQFKPYNDVFECDLRPEKAEEAYPATLFRFPLRTKNQAIRSEICQRHYDESEMRALLNLLARGAESLLLFTQNVLQLSVYHLPPHGRRPTDAVEIFSVTKSPMKILRELRPAVQLPPTAMHLSGDLQTYIRECSVLKSATQLLQVIKMNGSKELSMYEFPNSSMISQIERVLTAAGERLLHRGREHVTSSWLISWHMGNNESLRIALHEDSLLPLASVAVPLEKCEDQGEFTPGTVPAGESGLPDGTVFTYLPLPIHTGLPVHINGSFAVTSNRRYLCERNEDDKLDVRAMWNEALLQDAVCKAYTNLLKDLSVLTPPGEMDPFLLWPNSEVVQSNCRAILPAFFDMATDPNTDTRLFSDGERCTTIGDTYFLSSALQASPVGETTKKVFRQCLKDKPQIVVDAPQFVRSGIEACKYHTELLQNSFDLDRFFVEIFLPNIMDVAPQQRDELVMYALSQNQELHVEMFDMISKVPCIPVTPNGEDLKAANALIAPSGPLAQLYNPDDGRFPYGHYADPDILKVLEHLGAATNSISWTEIAERAQTIVDLDYHSAKERTTALLKCIQEKLLVAQSEEEVAEKLACREVLLNAAIFPVQERPALFPFTWKGDSVSADTLLTPAEAHPASMSNLIGCILPVADESVFPSQSDAIKTFLKMNDKEPLLVDVLQQLDMVCSASTDYMEDRESHDTVQQLCAAMYTYLQAQCALDTDSIHQHLRNKKFIMCYNRFLSPNQLALNFSHNCAPYLYSLPEFYRRHFLELMTVVGVQQEFETNDFVYALQSMHDVHNAHVLSRENLKLALQLVNLLNDAMADLNQTLTEVVATCGTIYIPDANGVLRSASQLCFNEPDCQWVPTSEYIDYSHHLIPFAISKQLGVNTKRQEVLKKHSKGIPFGQRERLTNRIKRILSSYPCDKEILKELLQNADDAGATEIHFIKDPRQHGKEKVFDDSWRPLQGPALCVYNNKPFMDSDLKGIQRLGEGSKATDPNKTGQYGVGFNCVYHLTDAPSFLTCGAEIGETLCVFDPHAKYVPGASLEEPGRRYDEVGELRQIFTDIFPCYLENLYDLQNGTMFRFPLRDEAMADTSELSDVPISMTSLTTLFSKFKGEIFDCLLFLNDVTSVTLTEVDPTSNQLGKKYSVSAEMTPEDLARRKEFSSFIKNVSKQIQAKQRTFADIAVQEVTYSVVLRDSEGYFEKWLVSQRIGFDEHFEVPQTITDAFKRQELNLLPRAGVAALLSSSDPDVLQRQKRLYCFLPLPVQTQLPVQVNGHFALDHEARRSLWHDEETGPKTEWNMILLKNVVAPSYVTLMLNLPTNLSSTSVGLNVSVVEATEDHVPDMELYRDLFPLIHGPDPYMKCLVQSVYQYIHQSEASVLPVVRPSGSFYSLCRSMGSLLDGDEAKAEVEWLCTTGDGREEPVFDNLDSLFCDEGDITTLGRVSKRLASTPKEKTRRDKLRDVLLVSGFKLVNFPPGVYEAFRSAGVLVKNLSPETVMSFFQTYSSNEPVCTIGTLPCEIGQTPFKDESTLKIVLQYCMQNEEQFLSNIAGSPFLLCQDGQLRQFSEDDPVYLSQYYDLLPGLSSLFIHQALVRAVFQDIDIATVKVFKRFDVQSFASLLGNELPEYAFRSEHSHIIWSTDREGIPNPKWIKSLWSFLNAEFERTRNDDEVDVKSHAHDVVKPLRQWGLLPAFIPNQAAATQFYNTTEEITSEQYLVPVGIASTVVDYTHGSIMSYPVRECLRKLGIPELNRKMLDGALKSELGVVGGSFLASYLVATMERPKAVLHCLHYAATKKSMLDELKYEDCMVILKYFCDSLDTWKGDEEAISILRSLPLFVSVHGDVTRLGKNDAYVLPGDIPQNDMDAWERQHGIVFLRTNPSLDVLYETLGCPTLSISETYCQFVFKNFEYLSVAARITHLQFLKDSKLPQLQTDEKENLLNALKTLRFLEDFDGILQTANAFHDPYHPVFKVMLEGKHSAFPPAPFSEFKWLSFLKTAGLNHEVSAEIFIAFANEVAKEAAQNPTDATFNKSRTLVTHLFARNDLLAADLLEKVRDIRFIPAARVNNTLSKIFPSFGESTGTKNYISFAEGVPEIHEVLVWTSCYLLPDWANPFKLTEKDVVLEYSKNSEEQSPKQILEKCQLEIAKRLAITEDPSIEQVVEHAQRVCSNVFESPSDHDDFKAFMKMDVMKKVYRFLQNKAQESNTAREKLHNSACIAVDLGQTFVKPSQVVINLYEEDQIMPYLFKAPTELGEFKQLFLHLGATLNATVDQYAMVLENIFFETNGAKLHPNELRAAFKAVRELFRTIEKHPHDAVYCERLFLPSTSGRLVQSTDLVFNNDPTYTDRITNFDKPFLVNLSECKLKASDFEDFINLLPGQLQPIRLTALVQEVLENDSVIRSYNSVSEKLKHQLNSRAFCSGILRIIKHEHRRSGHKVKKSVLDAIQEELKLIRVYAVDRVITYLSYEGERISGSESENDVFMDKHYDQNEEYFNWNIYINIAATLNEELLVSVAEAVNKIIGGILRNSVHYLQPILFCAPHTVSRVLDRLKIRPDHSLDVKEPTLPEAGSFIPIEDHHLLKEDFESFETGEYVGLELGDDETGGQTFVYAVILEKLLEEMSDEHGVQNFSQQYKVSVGEDRKPVDAVVTDLYKFHRVEGFVSRNASMTDGSFGSPSPGHAYKDSFYKRSSFFEPQTPTAPKGNTEKDKKPKAKKTDTDRSYLDKRGVKAHGRYKFRAAPRPMPEDEILPHRKPGTGFEENEEQPEEYYEEEQNGFYDEDTVIDDVTTDSPYPAPEPEGFYAEPDDGIPRLPPSTENAAPAGEETNSQFNSIPEVRIPEGAADKTAEQIMDEVSDTMEEAWTLPDAQKKKIIKRLLLKWHPDKNVGNEQFATCITQHIQAEIERLDMGLPRRGNYAEFTAQFDFDPRNPFAGSSQFQQNFANAYKFFFEQVNQRAKEHKEQRERYKENFSREYNSGTGDYNFDVPPSFSSSNPQPAQARRFLKQAQEDLRAGDNDYETKEPAYEWVCFKAHQVGVIFATYILLLQYIFFPSNFICLTSDLSNGQVNCE